jgi:hypothetical protein
MSIMPVNRRDGFEPDRLDGTEQGDELPDLASLRTDVAEREELAAAERALTKATGCPLHGEDPLALLARNVAWPLTEAESRAHPCVQDDPGRRLEGVCLLPVRRSLVTGAVEGVVVTWTTRDLISLDEDRPAGYLRIHRVMNSVFGGLLAASGFLVVPFGNGGAWLVTGRRAAGQEVVR